MNINTLMTALVEKAIENSKEHGGGAVLSTDIGEMETRISPANCRNSGRNDQWRKTWYLDGKRIAAAKLQTL